MKKNILSLLLIAVSGWAFGQGFPMSEAGYKDYEEYLATEGVYYPIGAFNQPFIWTGANQTGAGGQGITGPTSAIWGVDNTYYYKSIVMSSTQAFVAQFISYYTNSSLGITAGQSLIPAGGVVTIPMNILRRKDQLGLNTAIIDVPEANPAYTTASVNQSGLIVTKSITTPVNTSLKTYSIVVTVTNFSGSSTSGSIVVSDSLPRGCAYVSATGTGFTFSATGTQKYTATTADIIANNATKTYTLTVRGVLAFSVASMATGYIVSNDTDISLRPMVWVGTSITQGTGITAYRDNYTYKLKNWLSQNRGINVRVVNRAISSSQTNIMEDYRANNNFYDFKPAPKFLFMEHGVNDVAQSISTAKSVENVTAMITYYRQKYPTCYIIILAPFPANAYESGLATYRTAMSNLVAGLSANDKKYVKYIPGTGTAWNAAAEGDMYTTDGIHVNAAGRLLILNAITSYITSNNLTFP